MRRLCVVVELGGFCKKVCNSLSVTRETHVSSYQAGHEPNLPRILSSEF
jgi:hypothetical protein